jgi:sigma-E factor negative regulatory protein RseC
MIEENALVVVTEGEDAWVETSRRSSCGSCEAKGCGTGALSQVLGRRRQRLRVKNPIAAVVGEQVVLGITESALIKGYQGFTGGLPGTSSGLNVRWTVW